MPFCKIEGCKCRIKSPLHSKGNRKVATCWPRYGICTCCGLELLYLKVITDYNRLSISCRKQLRIEGIPDRPNF